MKRPIVRCTRERLRRRGGRGSAAVEFAVVLPLFLSLVMGGIDYGYFFFSAQIVTSAAREGARTGATVDPGATGAGGPTGTAATLAKTTALNYMTANGIHCPGGFADATCIAVATPSAGGIDTVEVTIDYDFKSLTGFMAAIFLPRKIHSKASMGWQ